LSKPSRNNYGLVGYNSAKLPGWMSGNIYYNMALPYKDEINYYNNPDFKTEIIIEEEGNSVYLTFSLDDKNISLKNNYITTTLLGKAKMPRQAFENADGSPLKIDTDYLGNKRSESNPSSGPFEDPGSGSVKLKVW